MVLETDEGEGREWTQAWLLTLTCLAQGLKAFSLFFLVKKTRVLLRIVQEIIRDMIPFLSLVLGSVLLMALLFTVASPRSQLHDRLYPDMLMEVFLTDFGGFGDVSEYSPLAQAVFIVGVLGVPLVLMNMLIAIMGDTYDRVMEELPRRDL